MTCGAQCHFQLHENDGRLDLHENADLDPVVVIVMKGPTEANLDGGLPVGVVIERRVCGH